MIHNLELLEKLAQIHSWDRECCHRIRMIALQSPEQFCTKLDRIQAWVKNSKSDQLLPDAKNELDELSHAVYVFAVCSDPVRELLLSQPILSEADVDQVIDYACIADVSPDPDPAIMLRSSDVLFMKLLGRILRQFPSTPEGIFRENIAALIAMHLEYPSLWLQICKVAELYNWSELLREIQGILRSKDIEVGKLNNLPDPARELVQAILDQESEQEKPADTNQAMQADNAGQETKPEQHPQKIPVRESLFGELEITAIQREEVLLFQQLQGKVQEIQSDIQQPSWISFTAKQKGEAIARVLEEKSLFPEKTSRRIIDRIARRMEAAKYYVSLREFVKFNALNHTWPELSAELINNRARFLAFESRMQDVDTLEIEAFGTGELSRLLQRYRTNDQLIRFLQLRPYFSGLSVQKTEELNKVTSAMPQSELGKTELEKMPPQATPSQGGLATTFVSASPVDIEAYTNLYIRINRNQDNVSDEASISCKIQTQVADLVDNYDVTIHLQDVESIRNNAYNLLRIPFGYSRPRSPDVTQDNQRMPAMEPQRKKLLSSYLKDIGHQLSSVFFPNELVGSIVKAFNTYPGIRIVLQIDIPEFLSLPWECLYIAELNLPIALVSKHSLVRYFSHPSKILSPVWGTKVRILAVFSSPRGLAPLKLDEEEKVMREVFENLDRVEMPPIEKATIDNFSSQIRRFKPHIIHFSGHGGLDQETGEGALLFERGDGEVHYVYASQFSTLCRDQNVSLVVLNACDTGTAIANDVVTSVAGALVKAGIPATIATTRIIFDIQSIMFVREFYRALADGYAIESAIAEARKRVNSEDWDWSAFALFVNTLDLDRYKLILERK